MPKKKKGKGKKAKKKPSIPYLEKEMLIQTIENLRNKIEWRKELLDLIKNDIDIYEEAYNKEHSDKIESINLLEKAIQDITLRSQNIKAAIPEAVKRREKIAEVQTYELASKLMKLNEEKSFYETQLQEVKNKLGELEAYDVEYIDEKIIEIENKLNALSEEEESTTNQGSLDESIDEILLNEMKNIFRKKISLYQDDLSNKIDENLQRIIEETRWWENSASIQLNIEKTLKQRILSKVINIKELSKELKLHKENCLQISTESRHLKRKIADHKEIIQELKEKQEEKLCLSQEQDHKYFLIQNYQQYLLSRKLSLINDTSAQHDKENSIKVLEANLLDTEHFGFKLYEIIKETLKLIKEEVKYSQVKSYGERIDKKNLLIELDHVLTDATKLIYELKYQ